MLLQLLLACSSTPGDTGTTSTSSGTTTTTATATTTVTTTTGTSTSTTGTTTTSTTGTTTGGELCPGGLLSVDMGLVVQPTADQPAVSEVDFRVDPLAASLTLSWMDSVVVHEVSWPASVELPLFVPMEPRLKSELTVLQVLQDGSCLAATAPFVVGSFSASEDLGLVSSWGSGAFPGRDLFLGAHVLGSGLPDEVIAWLDSGETLFRKGVVGEIHTVLPDPGGVGLWYFHQEDSKHDENSGSGTPDEDLVHLGWDGTELERIPVPAGHHDFALVDGGQKILLLVRESVDAVADRCAKTVYADILWEVTLATGAVVELWRATADGFPMDFPCESLENGDEISYLNGIDVQGDTISMSVSGVVQGGLVITADRQAHLFLDDPALTPLDLVNEGTVFGLAGVEQPHSLVCVEGTDWGAGKAWAADAIACLISNRRQAINCNTADLLVVEPSNQRVRHVAAWPAPGSEDCRDSRDHGNVSLLGQPNPNGDGVTRVSLYSRGAASSQVLSLQVSAVGTGTFTLEYEVFEPAVFQAAPYYVTALVGISPSHATFEP